MDLIRLSHVSKKYKVEDQKEKVVLDNISISFSKGLVAIIGKSGSGKSTLINMISLIDNPSNGNVYYENQDINKWSNKRKALYRNKDIGIIFQHYHLLENQTALFNIILPALINGKNKKNTIENAKNLAKTLNFDEKLLNHKCSDLSGGEKERVAILRALINNPKVIIADEPTGALDSNNSLDVMKLLKEISKERLVLLVSHNLSLVKKFAYRIITIKDGKIIANEDKDSSFSITKNKEAVKKKEKTHWINQLFLSNFKRRFNRNIISIVSLVVGLVSTMLIFGFSNGYHQSVLNSSYQQLDYGVSSFYKETSQSIEGSKMSLVQMNRPSLEEMVDLDNTLDAFYIEPNTDALLPKFPLIKSGEERLDKISYNQIYSFTDFSTDASLLIKGVIPSIDSLYDVVINENAYKYLKDIFKSDPLDTTLSIYSDYEYHYYTEDELNPVITDYFVYEKNIHIVGVVKDFQFLATPKIYYPYVSLKELLGEYLLNNLSTSVKRDVSWLEIIENSYGGEAISSYSYRLFLKDINQKNNLRNIVDNIEEPYKIDSYSLTISDSLFNLMNAASMGMELFLMIAIMGTALILGIISFSSYTDDKKISAILTCLGAERGGIFSIYLKENILVGFLSMSISMAITPVLNFILNNIIQKITTFKNLISVPWISFLGITLLFPLTLISATFLICYFSTYIPLMFSKKISPKEELCDE